jgi:hypothetical protein
MRVNCADTKNRLVYFTDSARFPGPTIFNVAGPVIGHRYGIENSKSAFLAAQAEGQTGLWFPTHSYTSAAVKIGASVAGLKIKVNGRPFTSSVEAVLAQGMHTISVDSP